MLEEPFIVSFPKLSSAEANQCAGDLAACLRDLQGIVVKQVRDREETQDFGATLQIILGTSSATAVATGIAAWLARTNTIIEIRNGDKEIVAKNIKSRDVAKIAEAFSHRK